MTRNIVTFLLLPCFVLGLALAVHASDQRIEAEPALVPDESRSEFVPCAPACEHVAEAQEPANTETLSEAAMHWLGRLDAVPIGDVRRFAAVVADETDLDTGLLIMSIGAFETRWVSWVRSGACQDWRWRLRNGEHCDHGAACGVLSIHLDIQKRPGDPKCADALLDDRLYVRTALRWLRDTPRAWANVDWHRARVASYKAKRLATATH